MVRTRLEINDLEQPFAIDIPVSINFNLADVREPEQRKASFSKTINLYGTNEINKLFENIFKVNIATQYFNKNLKTSCKYFVNDILNFSGNLQLIKINLQPDGLIVYECSIIGESGSLFVNIGEKLITGNADSSEDLDFSDYDHTYNYANIVSTRANASTGLDVVYPFIDKGSNGGSDTVFNVEDFLPCLHVREYVSKIIEKAGYTFTSTFLDSTLAKSLIVYPNIERIALSTAQLNNRQFNVGLTSDLSLSIGSNFINNTRESSPYFDLGNQVSGINATINESGKYNVVASHKVRFALSHTDPSVTYAKFPTLSAPQAETSIYKNSVKIASNITNLFYINGSTNYNKILVGNNDFLNEVATGDIQLNVGEVLKHEYKSSALNSTLKYYNASNVEITTGTGTITASLIGGANQTSFYCLSTQKQVIAGNTLLMNNALPTNIKQKDLLSSIFKAFNLYVDIDPTNSTNLIIEDFDTFYSGDVIDCNNLTDLDKDQTINPNLLDGKRYIYSYKTDADYYNNLYKTTYNEPFGTFTLAVENDFIKTDKKNELIFSPTPNVANYGLGIAHPRIYKKENSIVSTIAPNIRLLYVGGTKTSTNAITYKDSSASDTVSTSYLYAGHTDDAQTPTIDLNFGVPKEVYYTFIGAQFTDNNLYNVYHANYLYNLVNKDSKFITKYLWLNSIFIKSFNFRNRLFIDGAYYIVNKIENYTPLNETSTKVELLKILPKVTFTPTNYVLSDTTTVNSGSDVKTQKLNTSLNAGDSIQNFGKNCIAIGENIVIPESCENITAIGNNLTFAPYTNNVSVINSNDLDITESNVNYVGGVVVSTVLNSALSTFGNATIGTNVGYVDCFPDGSDAVISLLPSVDYYINDVIKEINFKKRDSSTYKIIVTAYSGETIDGQGTIEISSQNDSVTLYTYGVNWYIK